MNRETVSPVRRPSQRGPRCLLTTLAALAIVLPNPARSTGDLPTYELAVRGGRFTPETIEVPADRKFRLQIHNYGPGATEFEMKAPPKERILAPGKRVVLLFAPLKPGSYPFFDEFHEDTGKGRIVAR